MSLGFLFNLLTTGLYIFRASVFLETNLSVGSPINGRLALVPSFPMSTVILLSIRSYSISSRIVMYSTSLLFLQLIQLRQLTHLNVHSVPAFSIASKIELDFWTKEVAGQVLDSPSEINNWSLRIIHLE